jgi:hypothetical protein
MLMPTALLHPRKTSRRCATGWSDDFLVDAVEAKAKRRAMTPTGLLGDTPVRCGEGAVAVAANEYDSRRQASEIVQCSRCVVAYWIEHGSVRRVRAVAMKTAAFNSSSAIVERPFAETSAGFDGNRALILTTHLSTRMCAKITGLMMISG